MLIYDSFYFFFNMFNYVIDEDNKHMYLKGLENLEISILNYYERMKELNFDKTFVNIEVAFPTIQRNLQQLCRINKLDTNTLLLVNKNIDIIDNLYSDYKKKYKSSVVSSDFDTLELETGLNIESYETLNYLVNHNYGKQIISTLNILIEQLTDNPDLDVLNAINCFLQSKKTEYVISYSSLLHIERMKNFYDKPELTSKFDTYLKETDEDKKSKIFRDIHLSIIIDKLNTLYDDIDYL